MSSAQINYTQILIFLWSSQWGAETEKLPRHILLILSINLNEIKKNMQFSKWTYYARCTSILAVALSVHTFVCLIPIVSIINDSVYLFIYLFVCLLPSWSSSFLRSTSFSRSFFKKLVTKTHMSLFHLKFKYWKNISTA